MQTDTICDFTKLVRKYGGAASDAALDPCCRYFSLPGKEGAIAYRLHTGTAVVLGDPLAPDTLQSELIASFHEECTKKGIRILYLMASEELKTKTFGTFCPAALAFGQTLSLNPQIDPFSLPGERGSLVRRKVRKAVGNQVEVLEYLPQDPAIEHAIDAVGNAWLRSRSGLQVHTSKVRTFENRFGKRWFYSIEQGKVTGVLVLNRIEKEKGYLINRCMVVPEASSGTQELLVIKTMEALKEEGVNRLLLGTVFGGLKPKIEGLTPSSSFLAKTALFLADRIFNLQNRKLFWEKFQPEEKPSFLLFQHRSISLKDLISLSKSLNIV